jgi:exodeoxyribonuclease V gamma subunit
VLVSQLRDEIDALWGAGSAERLTTVHPLQPFSRVYFEEGSDLHTYAKEWRAAQDTAPAGAVCDSESLAQKPSRSETAPAEPSFVWLPPLESAQGTPVITLAQLTRFLRQPVGAFFRERLQVHLEGERSELHDEELFGLGGLDLYQLLVHQIQHVPTDLSPESLPEHARRVVRRLRLAGALPLAGVGQLKAGELITQLETLLGAALHERAAFPLPVPRVLIDVAHPHVQLQDALSGVLTGPQAGEGGALLLSLRANALADLKSKTPKAMPEKLIDIWLVSLAAAAMGQPLHCVVVGANAVLRVPPPEADAARVQLQVLLDTWAEGMRWPLPLPPALALQWLKDSENLNALHDLYEGNSHQRAERSKDPALARTYPTLNDLMASADFERLAEAVYAPLRDWAALIQVEALSDAPAQEREGLS